eukprot:TRINITY_DN997_c0_g2_i5.p1 TRINITY_DN997_c0_g2~~TRINITY_DN997_c0_g2_i5.p1  ORF type:complete len:120 (-),score=16.31 TRINITY_DN997_c0_g2_i5:122-481(-)
MSMATITLKMGNSMKSRFREVFKYSRKESKQHFLNPRKNNNSSYLINLENCHRSNNSNEHKLNDKKWVPLNCVGKRNLSSGHVRSALNNNWKRNLLKLSVKKVINKHCLIGDVRLRSFL